MDKTEIVNYEPSRKELNSIVKVFRDSIILNSAKEPLNEIMSLVENPFIDKANNDILSTYFIRTTRNTPIPPALMIFSLLAMISHWTVKRNIRWQRPDDYEEYFCNLWLMLLATAGGNKSISFKLVKDNTKALGSEYLNEISPNFEEGNGSAAFFDSMEKIEDGKIFWVKDEASKFIAQQNNPQNDLSNTVSYLLQGFDGEVLTRKTKRDGIKETKPIRFTKVFINTQKNMFKHITDEMMTQGTMRRELIVIVDGVENEQFVKFPTYKLNNVVCDEMKELNRRFFTNHKYDNTLFKFDKKADHLFNEMFDFLWEGQFRAMLGDEEGRGVFQTTYQSAWKYAVLHHIIHNKKGDIVSCDSMQWALKVITYHLNSFVQLVERRMNMDKKETSMKVETSKMERVLKFVRENGNKKGASIRQVCRTFGLLKEDAVRMLNSIKIANPKMKNKILELAQEEINKRK